MKTFVIYLENHDDVTSTKDKIAWSKARRILLVWPARGRMLQGKLDLVLLQRHASEHGARLGIVTQNTDVEVNAVRVGIPVFETIHDAHRLPWRRSRSRRRLVRSRVNDRKKVDELVGYFRSRPRTLAVENRLRIPVFLVGVVAIVFLALFFLPGAEIVLPLAEQEQNLELNVWASPDINKPSLTGGLPALTTSVVVEGQDQIDSTGRLSLPDQPAGGTVQFTNLTDQAITIPAGVVILTLDEPVIRFQTVKEVSVAGGIGETASVQATAVEAGSVGNIPAGKIKAFAGSIGTSLLVDNPEAMTGGSDLSSPAPAPADFEKLRSRLLDELRNTAAQELQDKIGNGNRLIIASLKNSKILREESQPEEGHPGDRLVMRLRVEFTGWYIRETDFNALTHSVLNAGLPPGFAAIEGSEKTINVTEPVADQGKASWEILTSQKARSTYGEDEVISMVLGQSPEAAKRMLENRLVLKSSPVIQMIPGWWPKIPYLPFRVRVIAQ